MSQWGWRGPTGLALTFATAAAMTAFMAVPAGAHPDESSTDGAITPQNEARHTHQHGDTAGHLPASSDNVELVSKLKLQNVVPEKIADVGVFKGYAYLGAWGGATCQDNGVHVVDIRKPASPQEVGFIPSRVGSFPGEGIQALHIDTSAFEGDILVSNNEMCALSGDGGMNIYDVSDPTSPVTLAMNVGDSPTGAFVNMIHSVFAWDAGDKAYAVMVDDEEFTDVDIMDITDPRNPTLTAEYNLAEEFPQILQSAPRDLTEVFLHDMVVKKIRGRQVMLLSYWDGGYVTVDVTDVHDPRYIGDTDFTDPDPEAAQSGLTVPPEGNGHQAEFTRDNEYVIGSDEDFAPYALRSRNTDDGTDIDASQGSNTRPLEGGETITGVSTFGGRACNTDPAVPAGDPNATDVAVVERGLCGFTEKVTNVIDAGGYDAVLVFNRTGSDACNQTIGMTVEGDIPSFGVAPREQGFAIFGAEGQYDDAACLAGDGTQLAPVAVGATGDTLSFSSYFDGWGYVHLYRNSNGKLAELDTYAIPEAHDPAFATGSGDLSVHEVATSPTKPEVAYFSYYSGGFRVAEIQGKKLVETAHFIDEGGSNFWGVQVFQHGGEEYVAASDRDFGLYIFTYDG